MSRASSCLNKLRYNLKTTVEMARLTWNSILHSEINLEIASFKLFLGNLISSTLLTKTCIVSQIFPHSRSLISKTAMPGVCFVDTPGFSALWSIRIISSLVCNRIVIMRLHMELPFNENGEKIPQGAF